eukprot:1139846-Pelagomonas_calceolata.AAC.2
MLSTNTGRDTNAGYMTQQGLHKGCPWQGTSCNKDCTKDAHVRAHGQEAFALPRGRAHLLSQQVVNEDAWCSYASRRGGRRGKHLKGLATL